MAQNYISALPPSTRAERVAAGDLIAANADYQNRLGSIASEMQGAIVKTPRQGKQTALSTAKVKRSNRLAEIYGRQAQSAAQEGNRKSVCRPPPNKRAVGITTLTMWIKSGNSAQCKLIKKQANIAQRIGKACGIYMNKTKAS